MPKRHWLLSLIAIAGLWSIVPPVSAQTLLPYTPQLDSEQLEEYGLILIRDVVQLARFQQYDLALPRAKLATQLAPNHFEGWYILGSLYLQLEEVDQGIKVLEKARNLAPDEPGILFSLGAAYFQKDQHEQAAQELESGLKLQPDSLEAWFDLGNANLMLKRFPEAIAAYQKAYDLKEQFWPAVNNIGLVKYEQGDVQGAIDHWRTALTIDREAAEPQLAIAVALYNQGKVEEGLALGEIALNMDGRYGNLEYLKENLWGERLLSATTEFLSTPQMQAIVARSSNPLDF